MRIVPVDSDGTVVTTDKDADIRHTVHMETILGGDGVKRTFDLGGKTDSSRQTIGVKGLKMVLRERGLPPGKNQADNVSALQRLYKGVRISHPNTNMTRHI